jgi:serine/threonine protein kinase
MRTDLVLCVSLASCRTIHLPPPQLSDVAEGVRFLHSCNVTHGGLKGVCGCFGSRFTLAFTPDQPNVLVDTSGRARITDFGLATVTQNLDSIRSASAEHGHSARWIAPEILDRRGTHSKEADVFSFAMITIEVRWR